MRRRLASVLLPVFLIAALAAAAQDPMRCGTEPRGAKRLVALHDYWRQERDGFVAAADPADADDRHVAVLVDRADLVARKNPFDLDGTGLRFTPASGGYDVARLALTPDPPGTPLDLGRDTTLRVELPFAFPFFGRRHAQLFVDADGSVTFDEPAPTGASDLSALLEGPPRIAPFLADLDAARGGSVSVALGTERVAIVWLDVPGASQVNRNGFALVLHRDGRIDFAYAPALGTREAVVGLSMGRNASFSVVDFSAPATLGVEGSLVERFSESEELDLVAVARRFYRTHPDVFEQLVVYTARPLNPVPGTLAFELNVRNEVRGIGLAIQDGSAAWGSQGRLASVVYMDSIDSYLDTDGFEILGHEVGHRWLAALPFRDVQGRDSTALLGRGDVHWSFFMHSEASVMEGNAIADRGGGRFETVDFARGYSTLDQYVMGLRSPAEVPPFFYVESPDDFRPNRPYKASSSPEAGVSFTGVRRDVRIEDVVSAVGPRVPAAADASRVLRQAFILVADDKAPATPARRDTAARIRQRFEEYYRSATGGRGVADSTLP